MPTKPEHATTHRGAGEVLLDVDDLEVHFALRGGLLSGMFGRAKRAVKAVDGVDLQLRRGEVLGVVGESGSGKTTLGRALLGLAPATSGSITYRRRRGDDVTEHRVDQLGDSAMRRLRTDLQMVFQDPHAALNPSMTLETAIGHPLRIHGLASGDELRRRVRDALERVGLSPVDRFLTKVPADLSGGQKQRAVIARAIIMDPEVLVADEPVSMLDMSVRSKILQLMLDLKDQLGLTYVYITHDLASAKFICDRVAIMYLGRIVEVGPTAEIFADPKHPYTQALLAAIPEPDPDRALPRELPRGEIPDAAVPPLGCSFHPRCPVAVAECGWESRDLRTLLENRWVEQPVEVFERESALVGDLDRLDSPSTTATIGSGSTAAELVELLERVRADDPDEPLWRGVTSVETTSSGATVTFAEGTDPGLRPSGGGEVACVLYGPSTT